MPIDLSQFHQVFFEESVEALASMETGLLGLDAGLPNVDAINAIFRGAHSMKGGSATFGFSEVANFTHHMETLLDGMRGGRRQVTREAIEVLLRSVDCLRSMLDAVQSGRPPDHATVQARQRELERLLEHPPDQPVAASAVAPEEMAAAGWKIAFSPRPGLLRSGNDPVRIFRELEELGRLEVEADLDSLPELEQLDPEDCRIGWTLWLYGEVGRDQLDEVFAWVEDDCDLAIQPLAPPLPPAPLAAEPALLPVAEAVPPPLPPPPPPAAKPAKPETEARAAGGGSIRVDTRKIDQLINMVGELVITQSMLSLMGENFSMDRLEPLQAGLAQLERHTRALQESVMNIRMLPISFVFNRFPRLVHDLSGKLGKLVELRLSGEQTELDKTVIEQISDPLVHLVRNSLDHGIESPDMRRASGKPETGVIHLNACHRGGTIVIEIGDDGRGLDADKILAKAVERGLVDGSASLATAQIQELIFTPGFSTAAQVTDVSGRGVGMDVVRRNIEALGGRIELRSVAGEGSTFSIHLPLTLAILDGQTVSVGEEIYIAPLVSIIESINLTQENISSFIGKSETFRLRGEYLPIIRLHEVFGIATAKARTLTEGLLMVVEGQGLRCGLFVDNVLGQQQVVIKSLEENYRRIEGVSGATILGDGSVALILDIPGLVRLAKRDRTAAARHRA